MCIYYVLSRGEKRAAADSTATVDQSEKEKRVGVKREIRHNELLLEQNQACDISCAAGAAALCFLCVGHSEMNG